MKIYLAAKYGDMVVMQRVAARLASIGHVITSRWIDGDEKKMSKRDAALMDLEDVDSADALILFTQPKGSLNSGGGRHVEFGYAIARGKLMYVVGDYETVFVHHPSVLRFETLDKLMEVMS